MSSERREGHSDGSESLRLGPWTIGVGVVLTPVLAVIIYALSVYGTVAPCGILQQEIMARAEAASEQKSTGEELLEQGAQTLGLALGEEALAARLESHSSLECAEFMWRAKTGEFREVRQAIE